MRPWFDTAAFKSLARSSWLTPAVQNALQNASLANSKRGSDDARSISDLSMVAERMVSVRPCLKPDVLADSYVDAAKRD
jgi:hypothetical protein